MKNQPFLIDAHLDLSMNAMEWNRDLRLPVDSMRIRENGMTDKPDRGNNTVSFPAMREGNIAICFATLIARYAKPGHPGGGWNSPEQAWGMTQAQLVWYKEMERQGEIKQIKNIGDLQSQLNNWHTDPSYQSIGYVLTLEGADSIVSPEHLNQYHENGLRAIGPAHYGPGTYAWGTNSDAPLSEKGKWLLKEMDHLGMALDATHLCDTAFWEALELFKGTVWASHNNTRALVDHNRQFSDEMIKALIDRDAVIGMALDAWMLVPNWIRGKSTPQNMNVSLENAIDHLVHICELAGNCDHVGIGTDLDGGFGTEQGPLDVNTISDLQKIPSMLRNRGFSDLDIEKVLNKNWLRKLEQVLGN